MGIQLTDEQKAKLTSDLDMGRVKVRTMGGNAKGHYLESYDVIDALNEIFGYGSWAFSVDSLNEREFEDDNKVVVVAQVTLVVTDDLGNAVSRADVGSSSARADKPDMYDMAVKGAVSDALKRAARTFGNQFGNSLYGLKESSSPNSYTNDNSIIKINNSYSSDEEIACEDCGSPIEGFTDKKTGRYFSPEGLANSRKRRYGKALCSECTKSYK